MSSDELSLEDGEDCVDDFGIELDEDEPMSYDDIQTAQRNNDDSMGEFESIIYDREEQAWQQEREEESIGGYEDEDDDDESSWDDHWLMNLRPADRQEKLSLLNGYEWNAFGLPNINCERCTEMKDMVIHALTCMKSNSSTFTDLELSHLYTEHFTDAGWRLLGQFIGNNDQLQRLDFSGVNLTEKITALLSKGMQRNRSVVNVIFTDTRLDVGGIRGLVPFFTALEEVAHLAFMENTMIKDKGLQEIGLALASSPVRSMGLSSCDIERVTINDGQFPKHLRNLVLCNNKINSVGCLALAKLLQKEDSTLKSLYLSENCIDDEGAAILANSLRTNTSLLTLDLLDNVISEEGHVSFFSLVNNISSISKTLRSNHTLKDVIFGSSLYFDFEEDDESGIGCYEDACVWSYPAELMKDALLVNSASISPEEAGRRKVINTQLNIIQREVYSHVQGVKNNDSLFSDIDCPLHLLPDMIALIGGNHGLSEMFAAVSASISTLTSLSMSKEQILKNRRDNLCLDMKDAAGEIKALLEADSYSPEYFFRQQNLTHEMGGIFQEFVELDRELSSYAQEARTWQHRANADARVDARGAQSPR